MTAPLLLLAAHGDPDWLYATGFDVEHGIYVDFGTEQVLVVSELEFERAGRESRVSPVLDRRQAGWVENADTRAAWAAVAAHVLRERGPEPRSGIARVAPSLPIGAFRALEAAGLELEVDAGLFTSRRRRKSTEEVGWIHSAQRAAEAACVEVISHLAVAEIQDGLLWLDGRPLTSERLRARAEAALAEIGYAAGEMIIAGSPECALPHYRGAGQIRAHAPVIIDVFPRGRTSGYHGDLTRTVVVGDVGDEVRSMFDACVAALDAGEAMIRAGVDGREVHRAVCRLLVERGFGTTTAGFEGDASGPRMIHSTGHGVGLEVHEAPSLRDLDFPLEAGDVVTVEPGLYLAGSGGVRVEDTGLVTAEGFRNFSSLPRSLDPRAYL